MEINQISPEVGHGTVRRECVELHNRVKLLSTGNVAWNPSRNAPAVHACITFLVRVAI